MNGLTVTAVRKAYGQEQVLKAVSFAAPPGSFVVIVGPSGCGKTTLLRCLAGLEAVDDGSISIGARDITDMSPSARNVAMVFQNYALYPTKTVYQNMAFGLRQRRVPRAEIDKRLEHAAAQLKIGHLMERRPSQLSGGQRQRVAIGRAMVREPALFLFDEPLSNLDAALRADLRLEIKRIHRAMGVTSVFVTHDQHEAMTLADLLIVMRDGRIEQMGPPQEVFAAPVSRFVAGFIGSPAMCFLPCDARGDELFLPGGARIALPGTAPGMLAEGKPIELGIRPEDLTLHLDQSKGILQGQVDVVQETGSTRLVYLETPAGPLMVSQPAVAAPPAGGVSVSFRENGFLLFDKETGTRIM